MKPVYIYSDEVFGTSCYILGGVFVLLQDMFVQLKILIAHRQAISMISSKEVLTLNEDFKNAIITLDIRSLPDLYY